MEGISRQGIRSGRPWDESVFGGDRGESSFGIIEGETVMAN